MLISRLFKHPQPSAFFYARLDAEGKCLALWALSHTPDSGQWVQVNELNPLWLGHSLPRDALMDLPAPAQQLRQRIQPLISPSHQRP